MFSRGHILRYFQGPHLEILRCPLGPRRGALICHGLITLAVMVARYNLMTIFLQRTGANLQAGANLQQTGTNCGRANLFCLKLKPEKDRNLVTNTSGRAFHCLGLMGHMNICLFLVIF